MNVKAAGTVLQVKNVFNSSVWPSAEKEVDLNHIDITMNLCSSVNILFIACGENANCQARNNRAECSCPQDFLGDARSRCYTECVRHDECSDNLACVGFKCKDPCREPDPNVCGSGANCEVKNHKPICSCPRGRFT